MVGSRGLLYEMWTATEDATASDTSAADYHSMTMDGSDLEGPYFNETNGFTAKLSGFFVAPYTGNISFYLESSEGVLGWHPGKGIQPGIQTHCDACCVPGSHSVPPGVPLPHDRCAVGGRGRHSDVHSKHKWG